MASGRIKGITIEIGGDTSDLQKSLKGVDSQLKNTQSNLKDINKLLKLDPSNTELLTQKQKALEDAVGGTKDRLQQLKDAQSGVAEGSAQWDALQREIIATEQDVKAAEDALKDFGSVAKQQIQAAAQQVKEFGDKMGSVGTTLSKNVTAPIAAVGAASLAAFAEVDAGLDIVVQKTGATGEAFENMKGIVENIATSIPADFELVGTAVGEVNTRFGATGEQLEALSTQFIQFAEINGTDVTNSIDNAQKALSAFGLGADSAGTLLDVLNVTGQATGASMDSLLNGLIQNGTAFQEMGLSIEQATVFMGQMETSGANSETVMNGLRKALKSATAEGIPLNDALSDLQNTILNGTDGVDGLTAAYDMFGKSGDQIYAAVKNGTLDFNALSISVEDVGDSVVDTFNATKDPMDDFKTATNAAKIAGADLGNTIQVAALPIIEKLTGVIKTLTDRFRSLTPEQQETIVKIGAIVAAIGPALVIGGKVISMVGSVITVLGTVVGVLGGPLTLAIGAVIALGVALWTNWDTIKEKAASLAESVKNAFQRIREFIKLPHFSISGEFSLNPPSVPHLSVDWYKKAMNNGVLFTQPTVLQTPQGLKGFGDAGAEVVLGLNKLRQLVGSGSVVNNINVYGAQGQSEDALAQIIMDKLTAMEERTAIGAL